MIVAVAAGQNWCRLRQAADALLRAVGLRAACDCRRGHRLVDANEIINDFLGHHRLGGNGIDRGRDRPSRVDALYCHVDLMQDPVGKHLVPGLPQLVERLAIMLINLVTFLKINKLNFIKKNFKKSYFFKLKIIKY